MLIFTKPRTYTITANTLHYYKLDGGSKDATGNNDGTDTNCSYSINFGINNQGVKLSGSSKIDCGTATNMNVGTTGSLTFIAWFKADATGYATGGWQGIVTKRGTGSGPNCYVYYTGGAPPSTRVIYADGGGTAGIVGNINFSVNTWNMGTWIYDRSGGRLRLYLNGVACGSVAFGATTLTDSTSNLYIGSGSASAEFFTGYLDEVIIENRAWSETEILYHYNKWKPFF